MMRALYHLMIGAALVMPLSAEPRPVALWGGLFAGMSREDVRAAMPNAKVILSASCEGRFKAVFQDDRLRAVRIVQYLDYNDCGRQLHTALMRRYGMPSQRGSVGYLGLSGFGETHDFYWNDAGRAIRLRLLKDGRFSELSFSPHFPDL